MTTTLLPEGLEHLAGEVVDVDSHEALPAQLWEETFGPEVRPLVDAWVATGERAGEDDAVGTDANSPDVPDFAGDVAPIDEHVLVMKGSKAPGAVDYDRRVEVMDLMGVGSQLMFPGSIGLYGSILRVKHHDMKIFPSIVENRIELGDRYMSLYQDYLIEVAKKSPRIVPVVPIAEETPEAVIATAKRLIDNGIKAIWLPSALPVGGVSPAHSRLDPLWAMCAEANVTVTLHLGGDGQLMASEEWGNAEPFEGFRSLGEFTVDPYSTASLHIPPQNFVTTMVLGGVFQRHPNLRFGAIEIGGHWIGPLMENMDLWHKAMGHFNKNPLKLDELPSTYVRSNIRVSFFHYEPVDTYIERYPGTEDVFAFSTDYPHVEGGKDVFRRVHAKLQHLGPTIVDKVFRDNGQWLLPQS